MKFEQVLQIYWTKGFLVSGRIISFNISALSIRNQIQGIGRSYYKIWLKRFELNLFYYSPYLSLNSLDKESHRSINRTFSKVLSLNYAANDLAKLNIIRLYLIKSYRGKSHALGKPVRGQRTWSNAWTSYLNNKILRKFLSECQKKLALEKKEEKINYKVLKKLTAGKKADKKVQKISKKVNVWF
jgi:ribosomal protein S13